MCSYAEPIHTNNQLTFFVQFIGTAAFYIYNTYKSYGSFACFDGICSAFHSSWLRSEYVIFVLTLSGLSFLKFQETLIQKITYTQSMPVPIIHNTGVVSVVHAQFCCLILLMIFLCVICLDVIRLFLATSIFIVNTKVTIWILPSDCKPFCP